jgi:hypothetical protein
MLVSFVGGFAGGNAAASGQHPPRKSARTAAPQIAAAFRAPTNSFEAPNVCSPKIHSLQERFCHANSPVTSISFASNFQCSGGGKRFKRGK